LGIDDESVAVYEAKRVNVSCSVDKVYCALNVCKGRVEQPSVKVDASLDGVDEEREAAGGFGRFNEVKECRCIFGVYVDSTEEVISSTREPVSVD